MKIFIFWYDSISKTRKKTVDRFDIFSGSRDIGIQRSVKLHQKWFTYRKNLVKTAKFVTSVGLHVGRQIMWSTIT